MTKSTLVAMDHKTELLNNLGTNGFTNGIHGSTNGTTKNSFNGNVENNGIKLNGTHNDSSDPLVHFEKITPVDIEFSDLTLAVPSGRKGETMFIL